MVCVGLAVVVAKEWLGADWYGLVAGMVWVVAEMAVVVALGWLAGYWNWLAAYEVLVVAVVLAKGWLTDW